LREIKPAPPENHAFSVTLTSGAAEDFNDLLPRILDISAHGRSWFPSYEVVCSSLARADWLSWPAPMVDSILDVFWAALEKAILDCDGRWIDELICGFALAKLDVAPFLARLEAPDARKALVKFHECNSQSLLQGKLGNAFWGADKARGKAVIAWFKSAKIAGLISSYYDLT
jgi:hypothetical protein